MKQATLGFLLPALLVAVACSSGTQTAAPDDAGPSSAEGGASSGVPDGGADASGSDGSHDGGATCAANGAACTSGGSCCSAYCKAGVCTCNSDGYACKTNADCCASDCANGTCGGSHGGSSSGSGSSGSSSGGPTTCTGSFIQSCAASSCASEIAATKNCEAGCGVFPSADCVRAQCAPGYQTVATCIADHCAPCDLGSYCQAFCQATYACGNVTSIADCVSTCSYYGATWSAACGAWVAPDCTGIYACGGVAPNRCGSDQFACASGTGCVPIAARCDTTPDCSDGSDESGCPTPACAAGQRRCGGACTSCPSSAPTYACDGAACVVGSCTTGAPEGATCVAPTRTIVVAPQANALAVYGARIGADGSRHVLFAQLNQFTPFEYDLAEADAAGNWTTTATGLPADIGAPKLVLDEHDLPHVVAWESGTL
jgi:hypothetical protein